MGEYDGAGLTAMTWALTLGRASASPSLLPEGESYDELPQRLSEDDRAQKGGLPESQLPEEIEARRRFFSRLQQEAVLLANVEAERRRLPSYQLRAIRQGMDRLSSIHQ